jgi:GcrA cell cycle regulator
MTERLRELHALSGADYLTTSQIAEKLAAEFKVGITKNSVIGRSHRLKLELRDNVPFVRRKATSMQKRKYHRVDAPIVPVEAIVKVSGQPITIYQLRDYVDCKWPFGDNPPFLYCGKQQLEGRPYCLDHCSMAYNGPGRR